MSYTKVELLQMIKIYTVSKQNKDICIFPLCMATKSLYICYIHLSMQECSQNNKDQTNHLISHVKSLFKVVLRDRTTASGV